MRRPRIDVAIHAQLDRRTSLLRDVERSGGRDRWSHLQTHGHRFPTILSAVRQGYLKAEPSYVYEITDSGKQYLADIEIARLRDFQ
jgi:DNA-binding PadR family transcriptional regulator